MCWLFHQWSRWSAPFKAERGWAMRQNRICAKCGEIEQREVGAAPMSDQEKNHAQ
jgi:hypothetical protein